MQETNFFLRTKLLPPRTGSELLHRPRLNDRLEANLGSTITLIAADAGCGKTTLIADFLQNSKRPAVWYQLDHTDADPIVFLNYVAQGLRGISADFGSVLLPYLTEANEEVARFPERAGDLLINEIFTSIEQPFILVLDDYHHLGENTIVHKIVDRILQYSSELLHLIITTRDLPPLAIMRRRTQSAALVIDREDLLFTDDEVRDLFRNTLRVELTDDQIAEYRKRTNGWITALQLVRQIAEKEMAGNGTQVDLSDVLRRTEKDIFDYFAEEVFSREDKQTQELLLHLSLLDSLPLHVCSLLFPDMRCSAVLPELAQKNIFLTAVIDAGGVEEYRFHPLFRDFLRRRLRTEIGQAAVAAERNRIAEVFLDQANGELALPLLLDAQNYDRAAEVIAEHGHDWIAAGAIVALGNLADQVPPSVLEQHPRAVLNVAEIARIQGDIDRSTGLLNSAVKSFHEQKDKHGEGEALHSLASIARRRARHDEALKLLGRAERLVPHDSETYLKCLNTRGLCLIHQGDWNGAEQQFRVALELAESLSSEHYIRLVAHNLALAPGFRGDFGEALRWFNRMFSEGAEKRLPREAIGHLNVARLLLYQGEFEKVETHLERALELCQLFNLRSLLPETLETYANLYREKGDLAHALEFYERALAGYRSADVDLATRELNEERAEFALLRGDTAKARALIESLIESREPLNNTLLLNTARLCLYRVDLAEGRTEGLIERIHDLISFFREQNRHYDEARSQMLLARTWAKLGDSRETVAPIQRVLDLSARFDYEYWLLKEIRHDPKIFEYEDIFERLPPDLREELAAAPPEAASVPAVVELPVEITDLTVSVLGHVEILRDPTRPFAPDAWTTRRARDIFCFIATHKGRRVAKDVLIDTFWGDDELEAIEKNFHPTISHIRKALNSQQAFKQNFIVFRDGAYQLNPEFSYRIDTEQFLENIEAARKAKDDDAEAYRDHLNAAYALYRGDFMEGLYEDWAEEPRQYYREQFARVLNALAKLAVNEKRWTDALRFATEVLAIDPYREDLHRLAMKVLSAQGKPAAVKKHYESMEQLLKHDLGISPAAETQKLFRELMK
jgi:LuxR family transcriptional regulator, maltose regulon positive regulatory protein